jgi:hypothetical protein
MSCLGSWLGRNSYEGRTALQLQNKEKSVLDHVNNFVIKVDHDLLMGDSF